MEPCGIFHINGNFYLILGRCLVNRGVWEEPFSVKLSHSRHNKKLTTLKSMSLGRTSFSSMDESREKSLSARLSYKAETI